MGKESPATAAPHDAGLGLVEVLVAVLILTVALLALVPVQVQALSSVALAGERQQATAYANEALERVRARASTGAGFTAVAAGRTPDADDSTNTSGCPGVGCRFRPAFDPGVNDVLRASASTDPSLLTVRCSEVSGCLTSGQPTGLAFTTRLYVTDLAPTPDPRLVVVTAVTSWSSRNSSAGTRNVAVRTQVASPVVP